MSSKLIEIIDMRLASPLHVEMTIKIESNIEKIYTYYSSNLESHLTIDRADALVMALIYFAIKNGYDIKSDVPVSAELLYNLDDHFIDSLAINPGFHRTVVEAPTIDGLQKTGAIVATGLSCGVDSLYTVMKHTNADANRIKLTHTAFFDVGAHAHENNDELTKHLFEGRLEISRRFAKEYNLPLLEIESNIYKIIGKYDKDGYRHIEYDTYMMAFCVLLFQSGFQTYLCSSSNIYANFRTRKKRPDEVLGCDTYDLLTLMTASINKLTIYSAGGSIQRVDKVKALCDYPPAWKYLNVCTNTVENCSHCPKCVRTIMAINAFGAIERFKDVFDVEEFKTKEDLFLRELYLDGYYNKLKIVRELFPYYSKQLTPYFKFKSHIYKYWRALRYRTKFILTR